MVVACRVGGGKNCVEDQADGLVELREYDGLGRLELLTHVDSATSTVIFESDYLLAADGTRTGIIERRRGQADRVYWHYEYDELGRLTKEIRDVKGDGPYDPFDHEKDYAYDKDSNRTQEVTRLDALTSSTKSYDYYSTAPQRLKTIAKDSQPWEEYQWTLNGELEKKVSYASDPQGETERYAWNVDGTLASVTLATREKVEYGYDHEGMLIRRKVWTSPSATTPASDVQYLVHEQPDRLQPDPRGDRRRLRPAHPHQHRRRPHPPAVWPQQRIHRLSPRRRPRQHSGLDGHRRIG